MLTILRLHRFRCYPALSWEIPAEGAVLLGANAQGKTSLLEALCFALTLHTPRTTRMERMAQHGSGGFGISLQTDSHTRRVQWQDRKLTLALDGVPVRDFNAFLEEAPPVVWLGNGDISLVSGAAEDRRHFLDFLGTQWHPAYRTALRDYRKALKLRNLLLHNPRRDTATLRSYAEVLARSGNVLVELRAQLLGLLRPHISHYHAGISACAESVGVSYRPNATPPLQQALERSLEADERAGFTTVGPHRDDFLLELAGAPAAEFASEGQQRTLAISLLLAQASLLQEETGRPPILLIDDVFGELDPARREALLKVLPADSQIFITATREVPVDLPCVHIAGAAIS